MNNVDFPRVTLCLSIVLLQCCASAFCAPQVEWITGLGTEHEDHVFEGIHIKGGGFCVVGKCGDPDSSTANGFVLKIDCNGEQEWLTVLGKQSFCDEARCVVEVRDGFIVGGTTGISKKYQKRVFGR